MTNRTWTQRLVFLAAVAAAATACSASGTVTINEAAVTSATSTAIRDQAGTSLGSEAPTPLADTADDAQQADSPAGGSDSASTRQPGATSTGCAFTFVDSFGDVQIELSFTSPLSERADATASYELFDGNGDFFGEGTAFFESLAPGEQVRMGIDTLTDEPPASSGISCALLDIEPFPFNLDESIAGPSNSCQFLEIDSFDDIQVELTIMNPSQEASSVTVDYVLRGPDGVRFGDGFTFVDVEPGDLVTTAEDTLTELPDWVSQASFSCEVLAVDAF